ncbi:hypothetical protein [Cloacibacillus porcorum]
MATANARTIRVEYTLPGKGRAERSGIKEFICGPDESWSRKALLLLREEIAGLDPESIRMRELTSYQWEQQYVEFFAGGTCGECFCLGALDESEAFAAPNRRDCLATGGKRWVGDSARGCDEYTPMPDTTVLAIAG